MEKANNTSSTLDKRGLLHLAVVYIVWGSTYLGMRICMRPGAGFTPLIMGGMRALTAGVILLTWSALTRQHLRPTRSELLTLVGSGLLLWLGGNGLVLWGEQHADSGLAALIVASIPIWAGLIESVLDRRLPSWMLLGSLLVGSLGIAVLSMPMFLSGVRADVLSVLALLAAALSWSAGTVLQSRRRVNLAPTVSSGYQTLFGGMGFILAALLVGEPLPHPILEAWFAWGYLVLFGSVLAFTSYIQALRLLPTRIVTTYSYVNPIIALVLGFLVLGEAITPWTVGGAALVLLGVSGVFHTHQRETNARQAAPQASQAD